MEVRHVFLADYFATDEEGKFLVGGGFHMIASTEYPTAFTGSYLIVVLERISDGSPSTSHVKIEIRSKDTGKSVATSHFADVTLAGVTSGSPQTLSIRIGLAGLTLPSDGHYSFDVSLDGALKQSISLMAGTISTRPSEVIE